MAEPIRFIPKTILNPRQTLPGEVIQFAKKSSPINVNALFVQAVELENKTETVGEAIAIYEKILEINPNHANACINLGTIYYNQRDFEYAEKLYRKATEADPNYALAWFNLGNALDDRRKLNEAIDAYLHAVEVIPPYLDAHYNLALAYERYGKPSKALKHWKAYLKFDSCGAWADHARWQIRKIIGMFQAQSGLAIIGDRTEENSDDTVTNQASSGKEAVKNETPELRRDIEQVRTLALEPELKDNVLEVPRKRKAAQPASFPNVKKKMKHTLIQYQLFLERKTKQKRQNRIIIHKDQYKLLFPKPPNP